MISFKSYCERKFPANWEILDKDGGLFQFRDNSIAKGTGFLVMVLEENSKYEVQLKFENFARTLSSHAAESLSDPASPLKNLLEIYENISVVVHKHYIETNLDPSTSKFENWDFNLIYKKRGGGDHADNFSDILISFLLNIFPYNVEAEEEGSAKSELLTRYERSHRNRSLCIAYHGYNCKVCGLRMKDLYGDIARDYIHVHHLNPLAESGVLEPDPIKDFVPLCPNCHAIAHLQNPPLTVEEIKIKIKENGNAHIK